ncbi:MAG: polysaccharide pyruvyl transferase family protein, partial [Noviherbaspirillum sp.]
MTTVLFGAFDRHNFGDLLFPHIAAALLPDRELLFAGLAERDLHCYGGHHVQPVTRIAADYRGRPIDFIHAGGELLDCDAWEAVVMLAAPDEARDLISTFGNQPQQALEWAQRELGMSALAPYVVPRTLFPGARRVLYNAVGGVALGVRGTAMRQEVFDKLRQADAVGVRERQTEALLNAAGITTRLMPDPAVMTAQLFGARIAVRAREPDIAPLLNAFPQGFLAVQFSADFGDDATLAAIATQLDRIVLATGLGVLFFRAGAAPWHDDLSCYRRVKSRMRCPSAIFTALDLWAICAVIANSRGFAGSSLHGRIVATAFALPRINFVRSPQVGRPGKQSAYAAAWEDPGLPAVVGVEGMADAVCHALATDPARLRCIA